MLGCEAIGAANGLAAVCGANCSKRRFHTSGRTEACDEPDSQWRWAWPSRTARQSEQSRRTMRHASSAHGIGSRRELRREDAMEIKAARGTRARLTGLAVEVAGHIAEDNCARFLDLVANTEKTGWLGKPPVGRTRR
jgi:hypothetical protein